MTIYFYSAFFLLSSLHFFAGALDKTGIGFVILSQEDTYHYDLALQKKRLLLNQAKDLDLENINVFLSHEDFGELVGHWTIFPLFDKLSKLELQWIFFLEDLTSIDLKKLLKVFSRYNSSQEVFAGYALHDVEPTIIHHFASTDGNTGVLFPHFTAGFFMSIPLIKRTALRLPVDKEYAFSIDPKYEIAKFIWNNGQGSKLKHVSEFCLKADYKRCASWIDEEFPNCGVDVSPDSIFAAVKTCHKFHKSRVEVVKNTWAPEVKNLNFFSDEEDESIPTVTLNVANVPSGHCEKTLSIMKYYVDKANSTEWLAILDDDTLINFSRLRKLLACYNSSRHVAIGERYGYSVSNNLGYDYITGGGGMIFSLPVVEELVQNCECPTIDSPDDMILGICLKKLAISVTHSRHFHQARPVDYSPDFLQSMQHISFHKHWMVDPYVVYKSWLQDNSVESQHSEL